MRGLISFSSLRSGPRLGELWQRAQAMATVRSTGEQQPTTSLAAYSDSPGISRGFEKYEVVKSWEAGLNSKIIRFRGSLRAGVISGVKVQREIDGVLLEKSYSPVSHPEAEGYFDLLVKGYPPRRGGGLGSWLCDLESGDTALIKIKPQRPILGKPISPNRWRRVGALVGGTGVAPLANLVSTILNNPQETTSISILASHASSAEALCLEHLEALQGDRFKVLTTFTREGKDDDDELRPTRTRGHIDTTKIKSFLPPPTEEDIVIFVCGSDGFVEAMAGPVTRVRDAATGAKHKVQGPTLGLLGELGYQPHQVMKL